MPGSNDPSLIPRTRVTEGELTSTGVLWPLRPMQWMMLTSTTQTQNKHKPVLFLRRPGCAELTL